MDEFEKKKRKQLKILEIFLDWNKTVYIKAK